MARASALARRAFADARVRTLVVRAALRRRRARAGDRATARATRRSRTGVEFARTFGDNEAARLLYGDAARSAHGRRLRQLARRRDPRGLRGRLWGLLGAVRALRAEEDAGRARSSCSPAPSAAARRSLAAARRDRRRRRRALARALRRASSRVSSRPAARPTSRSRSSRPCRCSPASAPSRASWPRTSGMATRARDGRRSRSPSRARGRRHRPRALDWLRWATPAGLGRGAAAVRGPAAARPAPARRRRLRCCSSWPRRCSRSGATSAAACCRRATPRRRGCACSARRRRRRCASERGACSAWLVGRRRLRAAHGRPLRQPSRRTCSPRTCSAQLEKLGAGSVVTPTGWLGFAFLFFVLAVSLFGCIADRRPSATRRPSSASRPCSRCRSARRGWLAGRLAAGRGAARPPWRWPPACSRGPAPPSQGADVSLARDARRRARTRCRRRCSSSPSARSRSRSCPARAAVDRLRARRRRLRVGALRRAPRGARLAARALAVPRRRRSSRRSRSRQPPRRSCSRSRWGRRSPRSGFSSGATSPRLGALQQPPPGPGGPGRR